MIDKHLKLQFGFLYNLELDFYEQSVQGPFWWSLVADFFQFVFPSKAGISWDNYKKLLHFWDSRDRTTIIAIQLIQ